MRKGPRIFERRTDNALLEDVRAGRTAAYGTLYRRHAASAYNLARHLGRCQADADELVSEAFAKVLDTVRRGRGMPQAFRAYLCTTLRHIAYARTKRDRKLEFVANVNDAAGVRPETISIPFPGTVLEDLDAWLATLAFATLPERWQTVLWHKEVAGMTPADIAPLMGLTPNGVSALACRAREGLKQAFLQVHIGEVAETRCQSAAARLGACLRGHLGKRTQGNVDAHLKDCRTCRARLRDLNELNSQLR